MIDAPVRLDSEFPNGTIYGDDIGEPFIVKRNVVDVRVFRFWRLPVRDLEDGQPVLRMIPRQEIDDGRPHHDRRAEHVAVPVDHRVDLRRFEHNMCIFLGPRNLARRKNVSGFGLLQGFLDHAFTFLVYVPPASIVARPLFGNYRV